MAVIRLLGENLVTDAEVAEALTYKNQDIHIYSNSYGDFDDGLTELKLPESILDAIEKSIKKGRNGRGSIYVFQGGNGGQLKDNCNYDGFSNLPFAITVGSITNSGVKASYSEEGACLLCVTPSASSAVGVTTLDLLGEDGFSKLNYVKKKKFKFLRK